MIKLHYLISYALPMHSLISSWRWSHFSFSLKISIVFCTQLYNKSPSISLSTPWSCSRGGTWWPKVSCVEKPFQTFFLFSQRTHFFSQTLYFFTRRRCSSRMFSWSRNRSNTRIYMCRISLNRRFEWTSFQTSRWFLISIVYLLISPSNILFKFFYSPLL